MRKHLHFLILTQFLVVWVVCAQEETTSPIAKVSGGHILVLKDGSLATVYGIACPSIGTSAGKKAKAFTTECVLGQEVTLTVAKKQGSVSYVRVTLADGRDLAELLLRSGHGKLDDWMLDASDDLWRIAQELKDSQRKDNEIEHASSSLPSRKTDATAMYEASKAWAAKLDAEREARREDPPLEDPGGWETTIILPGNVPMEMVWIPAGTFMMGPSPVGTSTQFQVTLTQGFWLGKYEVTKAQWATVMWRAEITAEWYRTPWAGKSHVSDHPYSPAVYVHWTLADAFIGQLNAMMGERFRLPSEAEWEYACRAGTGTQFSYGDDPKYSELSNYAWYNENTYKVREKYAHVVGQKLPNPWGLYDMHGNVEEWCQDWEEPYLSFPVTNPTGGEQGTLRINRGGSWQDLGLFTTSRIRGRMAPRGPGSAVSGFRLAR